MKLLSVDTLSEALQKLDQYFQHIERKTEQVDLSDCAGRYLAEEVAADMDMPRFRRSVVDGYAVKASDTFGVSDSVPVFLNLTGSVEMGKACPTDIKAGECVYVPTGGMLPDSADAVVMVEYSEKLDDKTVVVYKPASPGGGMTGIGDDFAAGEVFYRKGHRVRAKDVGILAAIGKAKLLVYQSPGVTVFSTGDEIIPVTALPEPGQVRDINSHAIIAAVAEIGVKANVETESETQKNNIIKDDKESLQKSLQNGIRQSDIIILSGGSSAGDKDMTAKIIDLIGDPGVIVHGLAMKPGKPTIIGIAEGKAIFGLPGHPAAALMVLKALVIPFIQKYYFGAPESKIEVQAVLTENVHAGEGRETFQLVALQKPIREAGNSSEGEDHLQDKLLRAVPIHAKSGAISQLAKADGYVQISSLSEGINKGQLVNVILL